MLEPGSWNRSRTKFKLYSEFSAQELIHFSNGLNNLGEQIQRGPQEFDSERRSIAARYAQEKSS